ncbi:NAD(P)/FAD-dependent oxidoreductase [Shewanella hanedai]|uniref:FAD-binding oxidoreductase n=1 Tax=Shewanella hanedai TaxID=25 RepID=A0A553JE85_SHEHA|nr:FAD-binding oxidoreductase [Shewanella hanedai]TRY10785.1 FAD-binding oxidoreductase [Shewanella hanedai]
MTLTDSKGCEQPQKVKERVTVIGAGIVGLTAGIELQRAGFQVEIIDKEGVAAGASRGNAGHFATEQVFPLADPSLLPKLPGMLLDPLGPFRIQPRYFVKAVPWFIRFLFNMLRTKRAHNSQAIKRLNQHSIAAISELATFCGCEDLLLFNGSLLVFEGTDVAEVEKTFQHYREAGVKVRMLNGKEVRELEPSLSDTITHGLYFTHVGHTSDPYQLCHAFAKKFVALGGKLITDELQSIGSDQLQHKAVSLHLVSGEVLKADKLLIASGAWSKPFAKQLGHNVPLECERGYHLMMPQKSSLSRPVASYNRKFIITPMSEGTRLAGTVEFGGLKAPLIDARADCLFPHGKALLPELFSDANASDGERWLGFRPSMPDSLPVLGGCSNHTNVFFSFGHQHLGLTWSAITAKLVAQQMSGKQPDVDLADYRIDRFN